MASAAGTHARTVALCAGASFAGAYTFSGGPGHAAWPDILKGWATGTAFSSSCAIAVSIVLPRLVPPLRRRFSNAASWALLFAALVVIATAASFIPMLAMITAGFLPVRRLFTAWLEPLRYSIFFTVLFGLSGTVIADLRVRLEQTSLALRTKERDEADARRLALEAQLSSLESRVQPHFFFNTLNSIAALVREDPAAAERVVEQLGVLMRSSLDVAASPLVALDQEVALVRGYLDIEQVRFRERLRYRIDVDEDLGAIRVPRLSLQTVVENSVKYAIAPRRTGGSIAVRAATKDGHLRLEITDDGPGFSASALPEGHGLFLLRSRLSMLYGDRASLDIHSAPSATSVVIQVPR